MVNGQLFLERLRAVFTSLGLTVVCLALGIVLVFAGTLAQVDLGLYKAQKEFFRSFFVCWTPPGWGVRIPVFPGGYLIGGVLVINLVASHFKRLRLTLDKAGIWMVHFGLILLLLGQFLTDLLSRESTLHLREGETKNYSESNRETELAIIDQTDPNTDTVVAIPQAVLLRQKEVRPPALPFTVRVKDFYANSAVAERAADAPEPPAATQGVGQRCTVQELPRVTDMERRDIPSAVVELVTAQRSLGTWLVSEQITGRQNFTWNQRSYELGLRLRRHYQPFSLQLLEFRHDVYPGTEVPRTFASRVRLRRPATGESREVLIYMNNPLRYAWETFYQAGFDEDDHGTILQVVRNPSGLTIYMACIWVGAGLLWQFLTHLLGFTLKGKTAARSAGAARPAAPPPSKRPKHDVMKWFLKIMPWFWVALFGAEIAAVMAPKQDGALQVREFGRLPVLLAGRVQPFDSVARNALLQIRSTGDAPLEQVPSWRFWRHPRKLKSSQWLLEVMTRPEIADTRPIFLIHHSDLLGELRLQDKGLERSGLHYYTFNELKPVVEEILRQGQQAATVKSEGQSSFQRQAVKLANAVNLYRRLKFTLQPEGAENFAKDLAQFQKDLGPAQAAVQANENGKAFDQGAVRKIAGPLKQFEMMAELGYPLVVPPLDPQAAPDRWQTAGAGLLDWWRTGQVHPALTWFAAMATAYRQNRAEDFNRAVADYRAWLAPKFGKELRKGRAEFYYNEVKAFLHAMIIYLFAFILAGSALATLSLLPNLSESLRRSSLYLVVLAGLVHTFGLVFRMALEGRPPVTNLYSSAIFIGWGTMVLGLVLERIYRVGIGNLVASLAGFVTLLIAQNLALGGDTMEMLRAVLDNNFWLTAHVVVITLGYAAGFAAGLVAIVYILLGLFTPMLSAPLGRGAAASAKGPAPQAGSLALGKALSKMVYGIVCFATLFSFIGTVLGGIWADQSWGRFWGWDPKENGALLVVLWNALILHVRWGGLARDRGIMNLAVFGNIVTSFSWFGVNMLGIGLHSYGFMAAGFKWLMLFIGSQVCIIALGLLPLGWWRSFRSREEPPASGGPGSQGAEPCLGKAGGTPAPLPPWTRAAKPRQAH
ncbi:MAG: cytochrome c biogenesis protein CcsA [Verrucomicrobiota bacterium]|jgi:cytochrome c-type biogenesis protein CcsB